MVQNCLAITFISGFDDLATKRTLQIIDCPIDTDIEVCRASVVTTASQLARKKLLLCSGSSLSFGKARTSQASTTSTNIPGAVSAASEEADRDAAEILGAARMLSEEARPVQPPSGSLAHLFGLEVGGVKDSVRPFQ